jgi:multicomponent Na+:H+ antiporter subunit G
MAVIEIFSIICVSLGAFFFFASSVALLRFPDTLTRIHAVTKADSLGLGFIVLALIPRAGSPLAALKLILVWLLVLATGVTVGQLIARSVDKETRSQ